MYAAAHQNLSIAKFNFSTYARAYNSVMNQLRLHIQVWEYLRIVKMQQAESGYQLAALEQDSRVACVAGFRISHSLGWGRYLYVDDLVTDELQRSRGSGKTMLDWLITRARHHQCDELHLDSGVQRHQAHRLYLRERMDIVSYHFRRALG